MLPTQGEDQRPSEDRKPNGRRETGNECYPPREREIKGMLACMRFEVDVCLFGL
jgi:hypothetical protein